MDRPLRDIFEEFDRTSSDERRALVDSFGDHFSRSVQVAAYRRELGWTQEQLADEVGLDQAEISRLERGKGNPTEQTWNRVAQAMGMAWESRLVSQQHRATV